MAITGTATYNTVVTLSAPGGSNADATAIAAAFNNVIFPYVSTAAATASASGAVVTITWAKSSARLDDGLIRDFVVNEVVALKASLNASVTGITSSTQVTVS